MAETQGKGGRVHGRRYLCGVPDTYCSGVMSSAMRKGKKLHSSSPEAFRCMERYLLKHKGYTKVGNREFAAPDNGPITVLEKKSRYGGALRPGKENRWMQEGTGALIHGTA